MKPSFAWIVSAAVWLTLVPELSGQTRVRLAVLSENDRPVSQLRLVVSGASLPVETQSNGECWLEYPPGRAVLTVYPPEQYEIVSPPDGQMLMPEDKNQTVKIWVSKKGRSGDQNLRLYLDVTAEKEREKERLLLESESLKKQLADLENSRQGASLRYDSLHMALTGQQNRLAALNKEVSLLREKIDLKKPLLFARVSAELLFYIDKLKDLRDVLPRASDAFIDNRVAENFEKTIANYNAVRDSLFKNHVGNIELVRSLWDDRVAENLTAVYDKCLVATHQQVVLPLNTTLLELFRANRAGEIRPAAARKKAKRTGNESFTKLNATLPYLETDVNAAIRLLR
jgi:hypothetical protein